MITKSAIIQILYQLKSLQKKIHQSRKLIKKQKPLLGKKNYLTIVLFAVVQIKLQNLISVKIVINY